MKLDGHRSVLVLRCALAVVAGMWVSSGCANSRGDDGTTRVDDNPAAQRRTATSHGVYVFDPADDRRAVAFSDNVFVGTVSEKVGDRGLPTSRPDGEVPKTQFAVRVLENVKGRLNGSVTVSQPGGVLTKGPARGTLELSEGDPLLQPEHTYVFVTRQDRKGEVGEPGWHHIGAPGYGNVPVKDSKQRDALVRRFRKAATGLSPREEARLQRLGR